MIKKIYDNIKMFFWIRKMKKIDKKRKFIY